MLALDANSLQVIDEFGLWTGGGCALLLVGWVIWTGRWRGMRPHATPVDTGPTVVHCVAILALYFLAMPTAFMLAGASAADQRMPGTDGWHRMLAARMGAELLTSAVMLTVLWLNPAFKLRERLGRRTILRNTLFGAAGAFLITPICIAALLGCEFVWRQLHPEQPPQHEMLNAVKLSIWGRLGMVQLFLSAAIFAPLTEELFFRGMLLPAIWGLTRQAWAAVIVSGALFGLIHSFAPQTIPPLILLGIGLGCLRMWTGSVWACIVLHGLFNARTILLAILAPELVV